MDKKRDKENVKEIEKLCKKNPVLKEALEKKMQKIVENPHRYKQLRYDLAGQRRAYTIKSFALKFEINEQNKIVTFIFGEHRDENYRG